MSNLELIWAQFRGSKCCCISWGIAVPPRTASLSYIARFSTCIMYYENSQCEGVKYCPSRLYRFSGLSLVLNVHSLPGLDAFWHCRSLNVVAFGLEMSYVLLPTERRRSLRFSELFSGSAALGSPSRLAQTCFVIPNLFAHRVLQVKHLCGHFPHCGCSGTGTLCHRLAEGLPAVWQSSVV